MGRATSLREGPEAEFACLRIDESLLWLKGKVT